MQERVLGALIIGGVAIIGVVWAGIEGGIVGGAAKADENKLESQLYTLVGKYDESVKSLDARVSTCYTMSVKIKEYVPRWGSEDDPNAYRTKDAITSFARIYGYTDSNEQFCVEVRTAEENPSEFELKKIYTVNPDGVEEYLASDSFKEAMEKSIVANHAASASTYLYGLCSDEKAAVVGYTVGDKTIVRTEYDEQGNGTTYVNGSPVTNA